VQPDLLAHQAFREIKVVLVRSVTLVHKGREENEDQTGKTVILVIKVIQDLRETPVIQVQLDQRANVDLQDRTETTVPLEHQARPDLWDKPDPTAVQVFLDLLGQLDCQEILASRVVLVSQE
jgi:hypothetical protein